MDPAKVLAEAGEQEALSALLLRKAWSSTPAEFFEITGAMEENFGHKGDDMPEAAQQANPDLVNQATHAYRSSLWRLLTNHNAHLFALWDEQQVPDPEDPEEVLYEETYALYPVPEDLVAVKKAGKPLLKKGAFSRGRQPVALGHSAWTSYGVRWSDF